MEERNNHIENEQMNERANEMSEWTRVSICKHTVQLIHIHHMINLENEMQDDNDGEKKR